MNLEEFIRTSIASVDDLRVLLLFQRSQQTGMDLTEVAGKLYLPPATAAGVVARLVSRGLLAGEGNPVRYRYQPASPEIGELVGKIVELDRERPVSLMKMMYPRAQDVRAFADAFRLRKDKEE